MTELRSAGRELLDKGAMDRPKRTTGGPTGGAALSTSYVLELRRLIREDAYSSIQVADEVARRILRARDI